MTRRRNRRSLDRQSKMMSGFIAARREIDRRSAAELELQAITRLGLTSCDFVGDSGCTDRTCAQCHAPPSDRDLELQQWRATWGVA